MKKLMSNAEYHQHDAIGSSLLKKIALKSLLHAMGEEQKTSTALNLGSAVHCSILEPEKFSQEFAISEKFDRRTKDGKAAALAFEAANEGKIVISEQENEIVQGVKEAINTHQIAKGMLTGGESEYSYFAEIDGMACKCRPDYFVQGSLVDLKTCQDASREGFIKACVSYGYHIQAAFYLDVFNAANGTNVQDFYFVAVETSKPFAVNTFKMGEIELNLGREQYRAALAKLKALRAGEGTLESYGYAKQINEIQFPLWALEKFSA